MEKKIKRQLVNAAEAVKRKVRRMRDIETEKNNVLETIFKPITKPLNQMMDKEKHLQVMENGKFQTSSPLDRDKTLIKRKPSIGLNMNYSPIDKDMDDAKEFNDNLDKSVDDDDDDDDEDNNDTHYESFKTSESDPSYSLSSWSMSSDALNVVPFGVRNERGKLMMGSARVVLSDNYVQVGANKYKKTSGIYELLFKKVPDLDTITEEDMAHYKLMLLETNVHRRDYDSQKPIRSNRGRKYLNIIKPLFRLRKESASTDSQPDSHQGKGLPLLKKWIKNVDYVYWDDPNELIERLKLLIASQDAGNTGLNNEIISIVEELRESGIIP